MSGSLRAKRVFVNFPAYRKSVACGFLSGRRVTPLSAEAPHHVPFQALVHVKQPN